jgi:hypothetical protein
MRHSFTLALCSALLVTIVVAATPAAATDAKTAIALCDKRGPDCQMSMNNEGSTTLCVKNSGKTECVNCPLHGDCTVMSKGPGTKGKIPVGGVLMGSTASTGNPPPKTKQPVNLGGVKTTTGSNATGGSKPPSPEKSSTSVHTNEQHSGGQHK